MGNPLPKPLVILRHCDTYDPERIAAIIAEGMEALDAHPHGRTMIKPNAVVAHPRHFPHAFTRPEFIDGLLRAVKAHGQGVTDLAVGERCGLTIPTRYTFARAGYNPVLRRQHVRAEYFDEQRSVPVHLSQPGALRPVIYVPEAVTRCDFLINAPKLKAHRGILVTAAMKNYIGLQDDAHRLIDHDHMLQNKVADLQEVISPGLIAMDGIIAGAKHNLTAQPFPLHLIILGVNPVAVDATCIRMVGGDPLDLPYIRLAAERGFGPISRDEIDVCGDVPFAEACERARGLCPPLQRIEEVYNGSSNITTYVGPPPDTYDYCWVGCSVALQDALGIISAFQPDACREIRPLHILMGAYRGTINAKPGERVLVVGDCACWSGQVDGKQVEISSGYVPRHLKDPRRAHSQGPVSAMFDARINLFRQRRQPVVRLRGCPVSIAKFMVYLSSLGDVANPYAQLRELIPFLYAWAIHKIVRFWRTLYSPNRYTR